MLRSKCLDERRGVSSTDDFKVQGDTIISEDNHCTFGALWLVTANELRRLYELLNSPDDQREITSWCAENQITWKFIPPHTPHFAELWEAAVRSMKHHDNVVIGNLEVLTSGHFLTGSHLQHVVEVDLKDVPENRVNHWRLVQKRLQHFWE
uniref:Uncharacterized protein n=1 Tax=Anopheles epiroticus TaxID=199890 RepID=A0A182PX96_9DIPT